MEQLFAVMFVLLTLWVTAWYLRRKGATSRVASRFVRRHVRLIDQVDKVRLTPQHSIYLLQVEGQKVLVVLHPTGVTVLGGDAKYYDLAKGAVGS